MEYSKIDFIKDLLKLIEQRWVGPEQVWKFSHHFGIKDDVNMRIMFFRELKLLIRNIPQSVFLDEEQRQNLIVVAQQAQDQAIEMEEEMLEALAQEENENGMD